MPSKASTSRNITFTKKNGNFMSFISCDTGDVYVDFKDETSTDDANYAPLFSAANPRLLELNISNSLNIQFSVQSVQWKVNGEDITENRIKNAYVAENSGLTLKIKGSIAALSGNQSITIEATARVSYNNSDESIVRATYHIPVRQTSGDVWHVTIAACDAESNYTINNNNDIIKVKCLVFDPTGAEQNPSQFRYDWYKWIGSGWDAVNTGINGNELTIHRNQVDNQAMFKVEAFRQKAGGGYEDEPLGMDTQMIYDALDEYFIEVNNSRDETIDQDSGAQIDYKIAIRNATAGMYAKEAKVSFYLNAYGGIAARPPYVTDLNWESTYLGSEPSNDNPPKYGPNTIMFSVYESDFIHNGCTVLTLDIAAEITGG